MSTRFHRSLLFCIPLLVTGCGDVNDPTIASRGISTTAITPTSISLSWNKATDGRTDSSALVYKVYQSGANPAYQSFDTIGEVEAGTLLPPLTDANSITISTGIVAGNTYYFNIVVEDEEQNKALYDPLGEHFHANLAYYYPFQGNSNDVVAANHLVVAATLTFPGLALDRFNHPSSAYNFNPDTSTQCLQSTNTVGASISGSLSRSVSFWVQSANTPTGTTRAAFAWGDGSVNGANFGATESVAGIWTVWLGGASDVTTGTTATSSWEHWVISYDTANVIYYKNGVAINTPTAAVASTADTLLYIGCGNVGAGILGNPYKGIIDEVRVYSQMLTGPDVANLYAVTRP